MLGVREAGVRSLTVSHQRCKCGRFAFLSLALGTNELGNTVAGSECNGVSDSSLFTCGGIGTVASHTHTVGRSPNKTDLN